jgi:hypothetical protein
MHHTSNWIIQHWPDLVPSLVGALIGGFFVLWGQNRADKQQRKRESRSQEQTLHGVLKAVHVELEIFNHAIIAGIEQVQRSPNDSLNISKPVKLVAMNQDYFVVFNTNASLIGNLEDTVLTEQIIRVYSLSKYLIDLINDHQSKFELLSRLRHDPKAGTEVSDLQQQLAISFRTVANITSIVRPAADGVLAKIEARPKRHKGSRQRK